METAIRGDLEWGTIPSLARAPAARFGDAEAVVDGDVRLLVRRAGRRRRSRRPRRSSRPASSRATGWRSGRRTSTSGSSPCSGCSRRAVSSCRSTPATRAPRPPTSSPGAGPASSSRSTASSATTTSPCSTATTCPTSSTPSSCGVTHPLGTDALEHVPGPGRRSSARPTSTRASATLSADDTSDILFTSGTTGNPKGVVATHGQTLRGFADWAAVVGLRAGRSLPRRQPVLPRLRVQGRHRGLPHGRRHPRAPGGVRHPRWRWPTSPSTPSRCCPGRRRSTRRSSTTPTSTASGCRRCASRSPAPRRCRWS